MLPVIAASEPIPVPDYELYLATVLGAFVLYVLNRIHGKQPFSICRAFIRSAATRAHGGIGFLDAVLSSFIGGAAVFLMTTPVTLPQAIVAGLGMTGLLSAAAKDETDSKENTTPSKPKLASR